MDIVLFHSVLGIRQGERDAADRLTAAGHRVLLPDLLDGHVFDDYDEARAFSDGIGIEELWRRGLEAARDLAPGCGCAGFSQGSSVAVGVATSAEICDRVAAVLQFGGVNLLEWFGPDAIWPAGIDGQGHQMIDDPFRDGNEVAAQAVRDVSAAGGQLEVFDYPGTGHLFTDPTLPAEYDAAATELMWSRVLPFLADRA